MGPNASPRHGSVVRTIGTLDNPLGVEPPRDEQIGANPDPSVNPAYRLYSYLGGGPVFRVPTVAPYGHDLLMVTHGEIRTALTKPKPSFYSTLGLAASTDDGKSWTDLGEIIRPEHPYEPDMPGFEDGDPPLASSADGKYLMVFYHDLRGHGAWRPQDIVQLAVARAAVSDVVGAAFGDKPHAAQFRKFFNGVWTEPGVGGRASNLAPSGMAGAERQVAYDPALRRYLMVVASPASIALSESVDALHWSSPTQIADFRGERHAIYTSLVGIGQNPGVPDDTFSIFYTWYPTDGASWMGAELRRLTVQCR